VNRGFERFAPPPRNLLLTALVVFVFPWDDIVIDALAKLKPGLGPYVIYGAWIALDCLLIWVVLASARQLAAVYVAVTAGLDVITAVYYNDVALWSVPYIVLGGILDIAYLALISVVLKVVVDERDRTEDWRGKWLGVRVKQPAAVRNDSGCFERVSSELFIEPQPREGQPPLFHFVIPLIISVGVAYAAALAAGATCVNHTHKCSDYGPPIGSGFFDQAAHIIAVLLVALAIEARLLIGRQGKERMLVTITVIGFALGIAAALTASAADAHKIPLTFALTVQALALGLATIVMLPGLQQAETASSDTRE
jgi:hypothetical protein